MSSAFFRLTVSAIVVLSLPACAQMPDYSPHYVQVPVYSPKPPHRVVRYELVPEACLTPDPTDTLLGPRLPPGCANNANLLAMVERKRDVVRGRELGPAPALPSVYAARGYVYGTPSPLSQGGSASGSRSSSPGGTSHEIVPASPAPASPAPASPAPSEASR